MILIIDNYDSFTFNLVQYLGELGVELRVVRNDALSLSDIEKMKPEGIVISPGPCTPHEAGISVELIKKFHASIPILGVCLGHQAIGAAFGGDIVKAPTVVHGKVSKINHNGQGIFRKVPDQFSAARYHSLVIKKETRPKELEISAWTDDQVIMGVRHVSSPTFGVQFHPESIATQHGKIILENFIRRRY
ncbi:MAG TPA: aminodeoxychorismate/anthranilate synthase component II [Bacteroidota bacterium]|nr:aminodeoxychorismate/anthranilate synthase component II [Bacteroidota bacterium]